MAVKLFIGLCLMALVQLLGLQITADPLQDVQFKIAVINDIYHQPQRNYKAVAKPGGVLLGAMRRLEKTKRNFTFNTTFNPDYGYYLESVNGVAGSKSDHTYWQILSDTDRDPVPTPVGVGCYIPKAHECIIFNFTTW